MSNITEILATKANEAYSQNAGNGVSRDTYISEWTLQKHQEGKAAWEKFSAEQTERVRNAAPGCGPAHGVSEDVFLTHWFTKNL